MPKYLTYGAMGIQSEIELSNLEAEKISTAFMGITAALAIEEKYNLLLDNYAELEMELLEIALSNSLRRSLDSPSRMQDLFAMNRRLANFLTTSRMYIDQTPQHLLAVPATGKFLVSDFKVAIRKESRRSFSFQLMQDLRNYTQHWELPLARIGHLSSQFPKPFAATKDASLRQLRHITTTDIEPSRILKDDRISDTVRQKLAAIDQYIDIRPFLRDYMEALARIHHDLREQMRENVTQWTEVVVENIEIVGRASGKYVGHALVIEEDEDGHVISRIVLSRAHIERREWLIGRNGRLDNLAQYVVSNEVQRKE